MSSASGDRLIFTPLPSTRCSGSAYQKDVSPPKADIERLGLFRPTADNWLRPRPAIAEIRQAWNVERVEQSVRTFGKAVLAGALVGGLPLTCVTVPLAIGNFFRPMTGERNLFADLYLAGLPLLVSLALVAVGSTFVGLPAHFILRKFGLASSRVYVATGVSAGFFMTLAILTAIGSELGGYWLCGLGGLSGAITAYAWSNSVKRTKASN